MKKGIIKVVLFYCIGLAATALTFTWSGHGHDAGLYPLVVMTLTILIGFCWTLLTVYNFYFKKKSEERKGMIYSQLAVFCIISLVVVYMR